jgi:hypothetical protein
MTLHVPEGEIVVSFLASDKASFDSGNEMIFYMKRLKEKFDVK